MSKPIYIVAEAGVNHNGEADLAFKLVDLAKAAGADAVKFQTFSAENIVTKSAKKAAYQLDATLADESQFEMLRRLELPEELHYELLNHANQLQIDFISTPFDIESLDFLVSKLGLSTIKLSSGDITNAPLLYEVGKRRCRVILSTGMCTMMEIHAALGMLLIGYLRQAIIEPLFEHAINVYSENREHVYLKSAVSLLHCISEYPARFSDTNLLAMDTLRSEFQLVTGLSDHSNGITIPIAAAARGAAIIEKHITLDRTLPGPDHKTSLSPQELHEMVAAIRNVECAMGSGVKVPCPSEQKNSLVCRKGVYAKIRIDKGEVFSTDNIAIKRPEDALSPYNYWRLMGGRTASKVYEADEALDDVD